MTQTHRFVCVACEERACDTFTTAYPTLRGAKSGRLGRQGNRAGDKTDRHHGGRPWRSRLSPRLAIPTAWFGLAVLKIAGVGIYYRYANISILYKDIPSTFQG